jgi:hypothetical protein
MWAFIMPHHEGRTPTHGYEATRETAMGAFAKSWRRELRKLVAPHPDAPDPVFRTEPLVAMKG